MSKGTLKIVVSAFLVGIATLATACSGETMAIIETSLLRASCLLVVDVVAFGVATYLCFRERQWRGWPIIMAAMILLHPRWTISPWDGDCGYFMDGGALMSALICVGIMGWMIFRPPTRR